MNKPAEPVILNTSDEAATYRTDIRGWVSRNGRFYGEDERLARWDGCTHTVCDCGAVMGRPYTACDACRERAADERFAARPRKAWTDEPLYSDRDDRYFWDASEVSEYLDDEGITFDEARFIICEPHYGRAIDPNDYFEGDLPEGETVSDELSKAFDALNEIIKKQPPMSWNPGKFAAMESQEDRAAA